MTLRSLATIPLACLLACVVACFTLGCETDQAADVAAARAISDPPGETPSHTDGTPLSLIDALRLTAAHNEQLASRGENYIQALADRQRVAAALRPTFDLFNDTVLRENAGSRSVLQNDTGINAQYRFLTGLGDLRTVDAADARIRSAQWLILDLRESLLLQTARAYYEVLRSERLVSVLESSVQTQLARLDDARARNEVGFTRPLDVAQIEAQVSRTRTQLIDAARQAREARSTLALLTSTTLGASPLTDGFTAASPDERSPNELLALARRFRQDILAARSDAAAARELVDAAISQYAPSITLNLDYFLIQSPDDSLAGIVSLIQIRFPLFSAGRIEADVRGSWSVFRQNVLEYRLRVREARRDVEIAASQLRASHDRAAELATQVRVAREALTLAEAAYQAGLGTNLDRIAAQDQLLSAQLDAASEEFITKAATLALLRACGLLSSTTLTTELPEPLPEELVPPSAPFLDGPVATPERESAPASEPAP